MKRPSRGSDSLSGRRRGEVAAVLAALAWSSAGIIQRQLTLTGPAQVAGRSLFAFIALGCYLAVRDRSSITSAFRRSSFVIAGLMAIANASFILALNHASVAHVLVFQALSPLVAALMGVWLLGERLRVVTVAALGAASAGVVLMVGGPGGGGALGNGLGALTALAFALVIVLARQQRGGSTIAGIWMSQVILIVVFGAFLHPWQVGVGAWGWLALLGVVQLAVGAVLFALAARHVPANDLALILLLEIVLGPLWTWLWLGEQPSGQTLIGGAVVLGAVAAQVGVRSGQARVSSSRSRSRVAASPAPTSDRAAEGEEQICADGPELGG
jgi:drug/metabolite transporter (DMT)-like permease